jgi:hypothetical protein
MSFDPTTKPAYMVLVDSPPFKAGEKVYRLMYADYGVANDDSRMTGVEHWSMTYSETGNYPSNTIPKRFLAEIPKTV